MGMGASPTAFSSSPQFSPPFFLGTVALRSSSSPGQGQSASPTDMLQGMSPPFGKPSSTLLSTSPQVQSALTLHGMRDSLRRHSGTSTTMAAATGIGVVGMDRLDRSLVIHIFHIDACVDCRLFAVELAAGICRAALGPRPRRGRGRAGYLDGLRSHKGASLGGGNVGGRNASAAPTGSLRGREPAIARGRGRSRRRWKVNRRVHDGRPEGPRGCV